MTAEGRRNSTSEEIARAHEELRVADQILDMAPRVAATRIHYAVFHAVRGLLFSEGLEPKSHAGVEHLFRTHFVRPGRFPPGADRLFSRLQKFPGRGGLCRGVCRR